MPRPGTPRALPHDGWRSRKLIVGGAVLLLFAGLSFLLLFLESSTAGEPMATTSQVFGFWAILVPSIVVPVMTALGLDKMAEARRDRRAQVR